MALGNLIMSLNHIKKCTHYKLFSDMFSQQYCKWHLLSCLAAVSGCLFEMESWCFKLRDASLLSVLLKERNSRLKSMSAGYWNMNLLFLLFIYLFSFYKKRFQSNVENRPSRLDWSHNRCLFRVNVNYTHSWVYTWKNFNDSSRSAFVGPNKSSRAHWSDGRTVIWRTLCLWTRGQTWPDRIPVKL